jgi:hypothetical protein
MNHATNDIHTNDIHTNDMVVPMQPATPGRQEV